jgi:hypothetical protein
MWIVVRFKSRPRRRRNSRPGVLARSIDWYLVTLWNTVTGSKVRHLDEGRRRALRGDHR